MTPRPYQSDCLQAIHDGFRRVDRGLVSLPTGTGKTNIFSWLIDHWRGAGIIRPGRPAIILAHREELLQQAEARLHQIDEWMRVGLERAGSHATADCEVIIASVQTVGGKHSKRLENIQPALVIVDEAHHAAASTYLNSLRKWGCFDGRCKTLGVTATPKRFDQQAIHSHKDSVFEEVFYEYSIRQAVSDGWLCPLRGYRVLTDLSLDSVHSVGGDFNERELAALVDHGPRTSAVFRRWEELAHERKTLVFCVTVDHARHAAEIWQSAGYAFELIHGGMSLDQRSAVMGRFRTGVTQGLCNVGIVTEGVDVPDVSAIVMLKPTKSWTLYVQMSGRGTRLFPGKSDTIILDVVDNTAKHDLCTVPSILDLPPKLDLNGATLEEAAKAMGKVSGSKVKALQTAQPRTLEEVASLLIPVELLDRTQEIRKQSKLAWTACRDGSWVLSYGQQKSIYLRPLPMGFAIETLHQGKIITGRRDTLAEAMMSADRWVAKNYPDSSKLTNNKAPWRRGAASSAQKTQLKKFGWRLDVLPDLDKGLASDLLNQEFAARRGK